MSLKKELGFLDIFAMASGAMISSGIFVLPGLAYKEAGAAVIISYILASLMMIPTIYSEVELATAMPKAGGDYFFIDRSLGVIGGTVGGMANWLFISLKTSFALVGIGAFAKLLFPEIGEFEMRMIAASVAVLFVIVNLVSVKFSGKIEVFLVAWLLVILVIYIFRGAKVVEIVNFSNFFEKGNAKILATAGLVFISYGGITKITSVAEEVKNPVKNIPLGMFSAFVIVSLLYFAAVTITVGVMSPEALSSSYAPLSEASTRFMGSIGGIILSVGALLAFITTANAGIMASSRYPIAMSRDEILPSVFSKVSRRFKTPYVAVITTGVLIISVILFLKVESLVKAASTLMLLSFIFVNLSVIVMRESKILSYRPKIKTRLYPYIQIIGIIVYVIIIMEMGTKAIALSIGFIFVTLCWYFIYVKKRVSRESALMYMVKRITAKELRNIDLDDELKDILVERDNIKSDRFDLLIENSKIIDIEEKIDYEDFFELIAKEMEEKAGMNRNKIYHLLMAREAESPTVIKEGLAIPHIVIDGEKRFELMIARCKNGINFSIEGKIVNTVFILFGTKDERNFHLKALMSIAQVVSDEEFEEKWLQAKTINELKNIIFLSKRKRGV